MSLDIETAITVEVFPDPDYHYSVTVDSQLIALRYHEKQAEREITFGSIEELEAVTQAMLKAIKFHRG